MADAELRVMERRAADGDPEAQERFLAEKDRVDPDRVLRVGAAVEILTDGRYDVQPPRPGAALAPKLFGVVITEAEGVNDTHGKAPCWRRARVVFLPPARFRGSVDAEYDLAVRVRTPTKRAATRVAHVTAEIPDMHNRRLITDPFGLLLALHVEHDHVRTGRVPTGAMRVLSRVERQAWIRGLDGGYEGCAACKGAGCWISVEGNGRIVNCRRCLPGRGDPLWPESAVTAFAKALGL